MPTFKTTENIFKINGELFDENWMDADKLVLPPTQKWDYKRKLYIEDIDIWEVICEPWNYGVYAAWLPYAEFYMITNQKNFNDKAWNENYIPQFHIETFYGPGSDKEVQQRMSDLGISFIRRKKWVDVEDMWLYE